MARAPLNSLQTFVAAAQAQNLTRAAERLHLTVSALSHQMRLLEERVDCTLFVRGPRGLKLTAEGQRLLDNVAPHLEAIEDALKPLCARCDNTLSLSSMPSMTSSWLLPRLPTFVATHPEVELNLDSSIELVDFADGRCDAALRYGMGEWPGLVAELLIEEWLTPVASPALLAGRKPPKLGELVTLFPEMMNGTRAHFLVYPERSRKHAGFMAFREWLLDEAARFRAVPPAGLVKHPRRTARAARIRKRA